MKKKGVILLLVMSFLMSMMLTSYGDMDVNDVKDGVVRIVAHDGFDWYIGSGFAIGETGKPVTYIVTNSHVVSDMVEVFLYRGEDDMIPMYPTSINLPISDVAVMEMSEPMYTIPPLVLNDGEAAKVGSSIFCLGFPANSDLLDGNFTGKPDAVTVTSGIVSRITTDGNRVVFYQIDADISGGNSGGPLIDQNGYVIGINSFGLMGGGGDPIGYNGSVLLGELISALDSRGYKYLKASEQLGSNIEPVDIEPIEEPVDMRDDRDDRSATSQGTQGPNVLIIGLIVGGSILFILILVLIIVLAGKGKKTPPPVQQPTPQPMYQPIAPQPQPAPSAPKKAGMLLGINGYHAGKSIALTGQTTFGRNPSNQVTYPSNHKGISGNHCQLEFDGNAFSLTDLGSSYGTFLGNGQKLNPRSKYTLMNGERFYLASPDEMFQVNSNG